MELNFRKNVPGVLPNKSNNAKYIRPTPGANIYTQEEMIIHHLEWELVCVKQNNSIQSFAELVINKSKKIVEIYNVYTHTTARGQGKASFLINGIKQRYPGYTLWLGIVPESSNINNAKSKLYARLHFTSNIKISDRTPSGKHISFKFIQMVYKPTKANKVPNIVKAQNKIRTLAKVKLHGQISIVITIPASYLRVIKKQYLNENLEKGSTIQLRYLGFDKGIYEFEGQSTPTNVVTGTVVGNHHHSVQIPLVNLDTKRMVSWHTHPKKCYHDFKACIGLPSHGDIINFFDNFIFREREICTIVFSVEAIYVLYIRRGVKKIILSQSPQTKQTIANFIHAQINALIPLHNEEMKNLNNNKKLELTTAFKKAVESIYMPLANNSKVPIFKMDIHKTYKSIKNVNNNNRNNKNSYNRDLVLKIPYDVDFLQNLKKRN